MATPKCPKCDNTTFENNNLTPYKSNHIITFINCSKCGCVVGTTENVNVANALLQMATALNIKIVI